MSRWQTRDYTVPLGVTRIENYALGNCRNLATVAVPGSVTNIGPYAFDTGGNNLTAITVNASNIFYSSLDGVLFNKNRTTLIQCPGAKAGDYNVPNSVTNIESAAFSFCTRLTGIAMPEGVIRLGGFAFGFCTSLTNLTIPNSVRSIESSAFSHCSNLTNVRIPGGVTNVEGSTFSYCYKLTSVSIPYGVTNIGGWAFYDCTNLTEVSIPNGVSSIGDWAFYNCVALTNLTIPSSVTRIDSWAFVSCTSIKKIYFEGNAPTIGSPVFPGAVIYYLPGTTGWGPTFGGLPTALWVLPRPLILNNSPAFGVQTNGFGFIISWATNVPVVVEASIDLVNSAWFPLATNSLTNGWTYFSDLGYLNYPLRLYRVRSL
jgi:hypothetical protein